MTREQFLDYEISLLLAKYGENRVIATLAGKLGLSTTDLSESLRRLSEVRPRVSKRKPPDVMKIIDSVSAESPEKAHCLQLLYTQFQSRVFLPELRDIRRFFDRYSDDLGHAKSRDDAAPRLFRLLARFSPPELENLLDKEPHGRASSLGIISDEILRRRR